ncbi:MAG: hypothetical protein HQM10_27180 [Candidatus Riflebacteria bacterium]|nr:hypothetical protein [Candidatus Riflebacteria bacterium]
MLLINETKKGSLRRLLQDWSRKHTVEECFQRGKSDLGMDHYEVRSWLGWHHHMTMTMLAMCFLEKEKIKKSNFFPPLTVSIIVWLMDELIRPGTRDFELLAKKATKRLKRSSEAKFYHAKSQKRFKRCLIVKTKRW